MIEILLRPRGRARREAVLAAWPGVASPRIGAMLIYGAAIALLLALRIDNAFSLAANSDEAQHLHVVWAWTEGLLPYRDVFDNHAPLFSLLCAPILALIGERADVVAWMRLWMIPLYFGALYATFCIGRRLWNAETGAYAAILAGAMPLFFNVSTQFRPDDLWTLLWLGAIAVALGPMHRRRAFVTGILVGTAFAVSAKTSLLAGSALVALATVLAIERRAWPSRRALPLFAAGAIGLLLVPALLAAVFIAKGAGPAAFYCIIRHNLVADAGHGTHDAFRIALFPIGYAMAIACAVWRRRHTNPAAWRRRASTLLSAVAYVLALYAFWPLVSHQDLLPAVPLAALIPASLAAGSRTPRRLTPGRIGVRVLIAILLAAVSFEVLLSPRDLEPSEEELATIQSLTEPADFVMDPKGDAIYRQRPTYWVLEGITQERMRDGSIRDDIVDSLVAKSTPLVVDAGLPENERQFVMRNYLPIDVRLWIAGQSLGELRAGQTRSFRVSVPQTYTLIAPKGEVTGELDGAPYAGESVALSAGDHTFASAVSADIRLVWSPALARGLSRARVFSRQPRQAPTILDNGLTVLGSRGDSSRAPDR